MCLYDYGPHYHIKEILWIFSIIAHLHKSWSWSNNKQNIFRHFRLSAGDDSACSIYCAIICLCKHQNNIWSSPSKLSFLLYRVSTKKVLQSLFNKPFLDQFTKRVIFCGHPVFAGSVRYDMDCFSEEGSCDNLWNNLQYLIQLSRVHSNIDDETTQWVVRRQRQ